MSALTRFRHKILVVDDNETNSAILEEVLGDDYTLEFASDGVEAVERASEFVPDLVLLDVMMPRKNGHEVCREIRATPRLRHAKVLMLSAKASLEERLEGYEAGADDYLTKPFERAELLSKVRVFLELKSIEEVDQLKTDMLNLLRHETRTPLTCILSPAQILMEDDVMDEDERRELGRMVHESATNLLGLFEKVIQLASLKSGQVVLDVSREDLGELVRGRVRERRLELAEARVRVEERIEDGVTVDLDATRFPMIVDVLLDNALSFGGEAGTVEVVVRSEAPRDGARPRAVLEVRDHGPGIDEARLEAVFEEFSPSDLEHHSQGHGLSLALSRRLVERHGGRMTARNAEGGGASFRVELPRPVAAASETAPQPPAAVG